MTWHWAMIVLLVALSVLVTLPIWVGLFFGRDAVCASENTSECLRDWVSALGGPLAIIAAIVAAWPVWEQLDENRTATRLALASVIRLEEQTIEGVMAALRQEDTEVENGLHLATDVIKEIEVIEYNGNESDKLEQEFAKLRDQADGFIGQARQISQEMDSKTDKDIVIPSRNEVEKSFNHYITELEQVKTIDNYKDTQNTLRRGLLPLLEACQSVNASIINYNEELLKYNEAKVKERNELEKKRKEISDGIALN
jgi:hypothetical protein